MAASSLLPRRLSFPVMFSCVLTQFEAACGAFQTLSAIQSGSWEQKGIAASAPELDPHYHGFSEAAPSQSSGSKGKEDLL